MELQQNEIYIGIDFSNNWTQISYYCPGMAVPETVSTVAGEGRYRIPTALCKRQEFGSWYLADGVKNYNGQGNYVDGLWEKSLRAEVVELGQGQTHEVRELLILFLRKVIRLVPVLANFNQIAAITFHLEEIDLKKVSFLNQLMEELGIEKERVFIQDDKESFCHFAMNQKKELMLHDVVLFLCKGNRLCCYYLEKEEKTRPRKIAISVMELGTLPVAPKERDEVFCEKAEEVLRGNIVSSVYLMGDGFDGEWLKESLHILCRGRKAFQGRNLYTTGACYGSYMQMHKDEAEYVYFSDYKLAHNVFLQVRNGDKTFFKDLVEAGSSCYEMDNSCQVLLDGEPYVDIWLKTPDGMEERVERLELPGLPKRPPKATRLMIQVLSSGKQQIKVRIQDLGFGEWYESSGKVWEYDIDE